MRDDSKNKYLAFNDIHETHFLTSDSIANSFSSHSNLSKIILDIDPKLIEDFRKVNSTIGGFILFPGNRIKGKMTINGERGFKNLISDRFDLTLECIRLHYLKIDSPLSEVLNRYSSFFALFENFRGYVDFFLLNDLVTSDYEKVVMFNEVPEIFKSSPVPKDKVSYLKYRDGSMEFTRMRNLRINNWAKTGQ